MTHYTVTGMSCAACSARVEKAVGKVDGVTSCAVSLLTNSMSVDGTAAPDAVIAAVQAAGYGASLKGAGKAAPSAAEAEAALEQGGARLGRYYLVGYTVSQYQLDGYPLTTLRGHNGQKLEADVVATFLPAEVVDSLYAAMDVGTIWLEWALSGKL